MLVTKGQFNFHDFKILKKYLWLTVFETNNIYRHVYIVGPSKMFVSEIRFENLEIMEVKIPLPKHLF